RCNRPFTLFSPSFDASRTESPSCILLCALEIPRICARIVSEIERPDALSLPFAIFTPDPSFIKLFSICPAFLAERFAETAICSPLKTRIPSPQFQLSSLSPSIYRPKTIEMNRKKPIQKKKRQEAPNLTTVDIEKAIQIYKEASASTLSMMEYVLLLLNELQKNIQQCKLAIEAGDVDERDRTLQKAQDFLFELMTTTDHEAE